MCPIMTKITFCSRNTSHSTDYSLVQEQQREFVFEQKMASHSKNRIYCIMSQILLSVERICLAAAGCIKQEEQKMSYNDSKIAFCDRNISHTDDPTRTKKCPIMSQRLLSATQICPAATDYIPQQKQKMSYNET